MANQHCTKKEQIATFDYLRKSTKGEVETTNGQKRQRQEKSIDQQRKELDGLGLPREIEDAGYSGFKIVGTFADEGVSGWKLGNERPGFQQMINTIKKHDGKQKVIRVDDIDRLSRATIDDTQGVVRELKEAGVRWIVTAAQGVFDLGKDKNDLMANMKVAFAAWSSHEYSRKLGRRIALARRNKAAEGKRSGSPAPYAMRHEGNGNGGLVQGDPAEIAIVRQVFQWFAVENKSIRWIAIQLNANGTPAQGKLWYPSTVKHILEQSAYIGTFDYGSRPTGRFYQIGSDGEVVEANGHAANDKPSFHHEGLYEPIIDKKLFQRAQKRFEGFKAGRKPRHDGYALSRILVCDHCGNPMYAGTVNKGTVIYRCGTNLWQGDNSCGQFRVRQDEILPSIMAMLDEEITALAAQALVPQPPLPTTPPPDNVAEIKALTKWIDFNKARLLDTFVQILRQSLEAEILKKWDERDRLMAEEQEASTTDGEAADLAVLQEWWDGIKGLLVPTPLAADGQIAQTMFPAIAAEAAKPAPWDAWMDALSGGARPSPVFIAELDRRAVNEALHAVGCEVRLRWRTEQRGQRNRHFVDRGRFRLGQRVGELMPSVTHSFARVCVLVQCRSPRKPGTIARPTPHEAPRASSKHAHGKA